MRPSPSIAWVSLLAIVVLTVACVDDRSAVLGIPVRNDLGVNVRLTTLKDGVESDLDEQPEGDLIAPGRRIRIVLDLEFEDGCASDALIARDESTGEPLAVVSPPLCPGHEIALSAWARR